MDKLRFESGRPARVRVVLSRAQRVSAAKALKRWPGTPDDILESSIDELISEIQPMYPNAAPLALSEDFRRHYHGVLQRLMTVPDSEEVVYDGLALSRRLLVALSCMALVVSVYTYEEPEGQLTRGSSDVNWDTLEMLSCNVHGPPYGASEEAVENIEAWWTGDEAGRAGYLSETSAQECRLNAFFVIGGPTPQLIQDIVDSDGGGNDENEDVRYPAKGLLQPHKVKQLYAEMEKLYEQGFDVQELADDLAKESPGDDLVEGLRGKWDDICRWLEPFLLPPAVSAAGRLLRPGPGEWLHHHRDFIRRISERDSRRKRPDREPLATAARLDAALELEDGSVQPHEAVAGTTERDEALADEEFEAFLDQLALTKREKEWARLRAIDGHDQTGAADCLGVSKPRASQLAEQVAEKLRKKMSKH